MIEKKIWVLDKIQKLTGGIINKQLAIGIKNRYLSRLPEDEYEELKRTIQPSGKCFTNFSRAFVTSGLENEGIDELKVISLRPTVYFY